jgi:Rab-GTPase-TBC domain
LLEKDCEDDSQIDLDIPRTISEHIFFRQRYGAGQRLLFQVLHCISVKFPGTGYVQGMAPIAATLLCYYPGEIAFVMLVRLWQDKGLESFFSQEFDGLMTAFDSLSEALKDRPAGKKLVLSCHRLN